MSTEWIRFLTSLEAKGLTFEQIQLTSDRQGAIRAAGVDNPLSVAVVETEWLKKLSAVQSKGGFAPATDTIPQVAAGPHDRASAGITSSVTPGASPPAAPLTSLDPQSVTDGSQLRNLPEELQDSVIAAAVLMAAVGCGGNFIRSSSSGFVVSREVPHAMRSLCLTVLPVADAFVALRAVEAAESQGRSLVAMAVGEVVSEISTSYAHQVARLQQWSQSRSMPLMGVVSEVLRIGHHIVRLRKVLPVELILPKEGGGLFFGPRLLNHLYEYAEKYSGSREDDDLLLLLLRRTLVPYLSMLYRWMHEGVLEDPFGEFFITEAYELSRPAPTAASNSHNRAVGQLFPELTSQPDGRTSADVAQQDVIAFERRFSINKLMIPSFLATPSRIAKMIFFTGKYCCLLREYSGTLPAFGGAAKHSSTWSGVDELHEKVQASFEIASGAVIHLLMSSSVDLLGHLSSLKLYFLQARSDWVVDFLDSADELLSKSPDKVKAHSVRVLLQTSVARCCAADPYHGLIGCSFSVSTLEQLLQQNHQPPESNGRVASRVSSGKVATHRCIELLQLEADLQWPLTLVLDAGVMRRFNEIFRLLTWLKTCERHLCALWHTNEVLAGFSAAYGIRHQMLQFLRQFQFYASHFILAPAWGRLMSRMGQADSVFVLSQALQEFFDAVELGLVLSSSHRFRSLVNILELTARFCDIGRFSSTATIPLIESTLHSVEDSFLHALSELASPVGQDYPQLVPLLTWIDFSGFYDRNNVYHVQRGAGGDDFSSKPRCAEPL